MTTSGWPISELASTANLVRLYQFQLALEEMVNNRTYRLTFRTVVNFDSHLLKSHQRPHAYSTHYQGIRLTLVEQVHRGLASSLCMGRIIDNGYVADLSVLNEYQSENVTMTKVA
jgi:hypothetical protein